ncbi:hypothetical protein MCC93_26710 [Morococcus cerebrosus]|uniref:Uncharacterized protein n=1 Tax=Morococcus cerebrosus TaxID=1056807 RepID=A0A0C1GGU2_9NEIS|nr:hypothetical protein MCC93_26710 [Morococcus cerebrosus]
MFSDDLFASRGRLKMGLLQFTLFWAITEAVDRMLIRISLRLW